LENICHTQNSDPYFASAQKPAKYYTQHRQ